MKLINSMRSLAAVSLFLLGGMGSAQAMVISGISNGYGLFLDVGVLGVGNLTVPPLPAGVSGTAPSPYDLSASTIGLNLNSPLLGNVGSFTLNGAADSDVDGGFGSRQANGSSSIEDLGVNLDLLGFLPVLGLDLEVLSSKAGVSGDYGNFLASGDSSITGLSLSVLGQMIIANLDLSADPNTAILPGVLNPLGVSLILNEQNQVCSADSCHMDVNALHLTANLLLGLNLVDVNLILGHSFAQLEADSSAPPSSVPEPGSLLLMLLGMMGLLAANKRMREQF